MIQDHSDHGTSKETKSPCSEVDFLVPLMHDDLSDVRSLILMDHSKGMHP